MSTTSRKKYLDSPKGKQRRATANKKYNDKTLKVTVYFPDCDVIYRKICELAENDGNSLSGYIRQLVIDAAMREL